MFYKYGVRSVSIDDICNEMHISKKTFYTQFEKKTDLVAEFLKRIRQQKVRNDQAVLESDNILEFILSNFKKFAQPSVMEQQAALFFDLAKYYPELYHAHKEQKDSNSIDIAMRVLQHGIDQGLFRDDLDCESMAMFMTLGFNFMFEHEKSIPGSRKARFMLDLFMRTVCSEKGLQYYLENK